MSGHAGRYELIGEIGAGGMGSVYRARDPGTGGVVALKQLSGANAGDKRAMLEALFEREYHTWSG
jgi:serine/threonine-protein kinase